ncbi:hypothetical protein CEXT_149401 [Caerostris extrusa]|uniref:Uncharacterized protein n=1 Tax=Caerostris extrusa TaxID=172846 RepID=A0AAV4NHH6_CAEEX|nr:hypothetical protein CEXT_149401 [Caerostris extrusa]
MRSGKKVKSFISLDARVRNKNWQSSRCGRTELVGIRVSHLLLGHKRWHKSGVYSGEKVKAFISFDAQVRNKNRQPSPCEGTELVGIPRPAPSVGSEEEALD